MRGVNIEEWGTSSRRTMGDAVNQEHRNKETIL
jgi:hypothetical protein